MYLSGSGVGLGGIGGRVLVKSPYQRVIYQHVQCDAGVVRCQRHQQGQPQEHYFYLDNGTG